jgi:hypothetical protein
MIYSYYYNSAQVTFKKQTGKLWVGLSSDAFSFKTIALNATESPINCTTFVTFFLGFSFTGICREMD